MAKNSNDKYYTPPEVVKKVMEVLKKYFPNAKEIIEPSAGDGAFIPAIKETGIPYAFYDLYPEHPEIEKMDFKELKLGYRPGRIFVGNPPFGNASSLFKRFVKGACEMGDGAVYVGPASHWNMKWGWKGLRLVYSEHLGDVEYYTSEGNGEAKKVNTCLNVYMRGEEDMVDRASMVEGDIRITSTRNMPKGERPEGLYFGYFGDGLLGRITNDPDKWKTICWKIDILNNEREKDIMKFMEGFRERYYNEIKKGSSAGAGISIYDFKQKLAEWLYPTREERLERDVKIHTIHKYTDERGILENDWKDYEYFISGWGDIGTITKEPKYNISWGIKILNEEMRPKIEKLLFSLKDKGLGKYGMGADYLKMIELKEYLIKHLYPTREERLEQDVEITYFRLPETIRDGYDFIVPAWGKRMGKMQEKSDVKDAGTIGIKILNEDRRKDIECFFKIFKRDDVKDLCASGNYIKKEWLKQKLAEYLYPEDEYGYSFYNEKDLPIKKAEPVHAAIALF